MPHCLSEAVAENSPETLRKWMVVIENSQKEDIFLLAAFILVWLVKKGIGIEWLKEVLLPLGVFLKC